MHLWRTTIRSLSASLSQGFGFFLFGHRFQQGLPRPVEVAVEVQVQDPTAFFFFLCEHQHHPALADLVEVAAGPVALVVVPSHSETDLAAGSMLAVLAVVVSMLAVALAAAPTGVALVGVTTVAAVDLAEGSMLAAEAVVPQVPTIAARVVESTFVEVALMIGQAVEPIFVEVVVWELVPALAVEEALSGPEFVDSASD